MRKRIRYRGAAALAAALLLGCSPSCKESSLGESAPSASAQASVTVSATTTVGSGGGGSTTGTGGGSEECGALPSQPSWAPPTTGWSPVAWPNPCDVMVAADPTIALPPLEWVPCCAALPGCEIMHVRWRFEGPWPWMRASVLPWGGGYRIGVAIMLDGLGHNVAGVYDTDGTPLVAWRTVGHEYCGFREPLVTSDRVWFGAMNAEATPMSSFVAPIWSELATVATTLPITDGVVAWRASKDLAAFWMVDTYTVKIYDLAQNKLHSYGGPAMQHGHPVVAGDQVVAYASPSGDTAYVGVWSRATENMQVVYAPTAPDRVSSACSDGQTLAWIVQPSWDMPGQLWTSPLVDNAAALVPSVRRPTPVITWQFSAASAGYWAQWSRRAWQQTGPGDNLMHVYRLSDAHHWSFAFPDKWTVVIDVVHADASNVFFVADGPLARQSMAAVGAGDAAP